METEKYVFLQTNKNAKLKKKKKKTLKGCRYKNERSSPL